MEKLLREIQGNSFRIFTFVILLVFSVVSCRSEEGGDVMLAESDDGSSVKLSLDQNLIITLESNPSTGYSWVVLAIDTTILKKKGDNEPVTPENGEGIKPGSSGKEKLTFQAVGQGTMTLKLGYKQPWDEQAKPEKTFTVEVTVK